MRTNDMIYQAAIAHQTDLRRTASGRSVTAERNNRPAAWLRLFARVAAQQSQAPAAAQPAGNGVRIRHASA